MPTKRHQIQPTRKAKRQKIGEETENAFVDLSELISRNYQNEFPMVILDYAAQLKTMADLRDFTGRVRDTIWAHFKDENSDHEKIKSNRFVFSTV